MPTAPKAPEKPTTLMGALLEAQRKLPKLHKNETAEVVSQKGSKYTYKYLTLDTLMEQVLPVLNDQELVWVTLPGRDDHGLVLRYRLIHAPTNESIDGVMPLMIKAADAQAQGSAISYARRYSLMALLGIAADEDDDGAAAKAAAEAAAREARKAAEAANAPSGAPLSDEARQRVLKAITDGHQSVDLVLAAVGLDSQEQMTAAHAHKIKTLLDGAGNGAKS